VLTETRETLFTISSSPKTSGVSPLSMTGPPLPPNRSPTTNKFNAGEYRSLIDLDHPCYEDLMALVDSITEPVLANGVVPRSHSRQPPQSTKSNLVLKFKFKSQILS
jgi:hypothetical protein